MKRYYSPAGRLPDARKRPDAGRTACRSGRSWDSDVECMVYTSRAAALAAVEMSKRGEPRFAFFMLLKET